MTWEWSHTQEAYDYARQQMEELDRKVRNVIAAEWLAAIPHPRWGISFHAELDLKKYNKSLVRVADWNDDKINEFIWKKMDELRHCTNGGWEAWCCPFGCGCHMVNFSEEEEECESLAAVG